MTWYRNDSEPVFLLSSNSSLPPAQPRFSLVNASSLHIEALSLQDEGNYTCWEVLNETRWFQVWLQVTSKWWVGTETGWRGAQSLGPEEASGVNGLGFILGSATCKLNDLSYLLFPHLYNGDKGDSCLIELL